MKGFSWLLTGGMVLAAAHTSAQHTIQDTSITLVPLTISYAYQLPGGNMAERFGANHNVAFSASVKFKSNYSLGIEGSFIFGDRVNDRSILRNMLTSNGVVVNQDGGAANILLFERGYSAFAFAGKVIPVAGPNPNSGILLKIGAGALVHKQLIQHQNDELPALEGEYLKGYDRLTAGPAGLFFVGYQHLGNNRRVNFVVGFEIMMGLTHSLRPFDFDRGRAETGKRLDMLSGLRAGWTFPIYKVRDDRQYYR